MLTDTWLYFIVCLLLTWLLAHLYQFLAIRFHWMDHPNYRSAHDRPIPTGAGVSFVIVFLPALGLAFNEGRVGEGILYACLGPVMVGLVGLRDDIRALPWMVRAAGHFLAGIWCIYWIGFPVLNVQGNMIDPGFAGPVFGVISLVWLLNLYNFMDGIDGIAAGEAAFACLGALIIGGVSELQGGWNLVVLIALAVSIGFLFINWPPAKVFMGDVGSGFLGLLLGVLILAHGQVSVWSWVILLGYFITDACLTITVRLIRGERIYESHNQHAYQHLARQIGAYPALVTLMSVNGLWLLPIAFLADIFPDWGFTLLILASLPLLAAEFICGAGRERSVFAKRKS